MLMKKNYNSLYKIEENTTIITLIKYHSLAIKVSKASKEHKARWNEAKLFTDDINILRKSSNYDKRLFCITTNE